ncbi:MAG: OmpA family protein [Phycisphaerales bacterium]|nr:OmpA family protein [Phycisphaerales bacterium]
MSEEKHEAHGDGGAHGGGGHGGGGHGGGAHEEHEGAPEWLISFADNVALLMGFFVILLAMNMQKPKTGGLGGENQNPSQQDMDMVDAVISIRAAFHNPVDMTSDDPSEAPLRSRIRERAEGRSQQAAESGDAEEAQAIRPTDFSSLGGFVPFEDGAVTLTASAKKNAEAMAAPLVGLRWVIEVRGHASPSETFRDPEKGMTLSNRRAMAVARVLVAKGVSWQQLRLVSAGDGERKIERSFDRASDALNQRAEVVVTRTPFDDPPAGTRAATPPGR